jgi:serine/threonine protein kinase
MVDRVGQQLGNYRLVSLLGQGGYAEVYLGQHVRFCQGRCNHEPILNWPPWLNELQRTTTMSAGEQTPTKLRQNQVILTPTSKRRLPNAG